MRLWMTAVHLGVAGGIALLVSGCLSARSVDRLVARSVADKAAAVPDSSNAVRDATAAIQPTNILTAPVSLDLRTALDLAARHSRSLQTRREQLFLQGLDTLAVRRSFGPQLAGTVEYLLHRPSDAARHADGALDLTVSQKLPLGGTLSANAGGDVTTVSGGTNGADRYGSTAGISLTQPLLQGAGHEASHDPEIQAERQLLYQVRAFALDRQDQALAVMRGFFGLLIEQANVANTRTNVEQAVFLRRRSEAMFRVRKAKVDDVLRARQNEIIASNAMTSAGIALDTKISQFLADLGLPVTLPVVLAGSVPDTKPLPLTQDACLALALERRLDLHTEQDRLADAERRVRVARNALWPRLDAVGSAALNGRSPDSWGAADYEHLLTAGLRMDLPLDKRGERDAWRRARLLADQAARALAEKRDAIRVQVADGVRRLALQEQTVRMQRENQSLSERNVRATLLRFRNGEADNLAVVTAQEALLNANNSYIRALAGHAEQRAALLRAVGLLDVGPDGALLELSADGGTGRPVY